MRVAFRRSRVCGDRQFPCSLGIRIRSAATDGFSAAERSRLLRRYRYEVLEPLPNRLLVPGDGARAEECLFEQQDLVLDTIESLAGRRGIDGVILTPHWGYEYQHAPNDRQRALARAAIDAGAIAVIGAHPHVVQPAERMVSQDGREGFVIYSLGNFVSNQRELPRRSTLIALLGLAATPWGDLAVSGFAWVPLHVNFRDGIAEIAAEAIERSGGRGIGSHNHLTDLLPAGNIHPPGPPLTALQCPDTSANGSMARLQHGFARVPIPPRMPGLEPGA